MKMLIGSRWALLTAALACALVLGASLVWPYATAQLPSLDWAFWAAPPLQALGTFAMGKHLRARGSKGGWPLGVGYATAALWVVALIGSTLGVAAGAGGLVYGLLVALPATAAAMVLQVVAFIAFVLRERRSS